MQEKLDNKLETKEIIQTRNRRPALPFRDSAIEKITKTNTEFGKKRFKEFKFDVSKGSSLKGLLLRYSKATARKDFTMSFWFQGKPDYYTIGQFPKVRCKDVEKICLELADKHQDHRGLWIKNPNQTKADEKRLIPKKDTSLPAGKTINEVFESYCGADEDEGHRGFLKDVKQGYKTS